ncbi:hypothetical protein CRUP_006074 [Coryphaenoides rupestris]|nr:hypothetical protein CRUP_006074 [Coryphaenoides rupestris]
MHSEACEVACRLEAHSTGAPGHDGNASLLPGKDCAEEDRVTHRIHKLFFVFRRRRKALVGCPKESVAGLLAGKPRCRGAPTSWRTPGQKQSLAYFGFDTDADAAILPGRDLLPACAMSQIAYSGKRPTSAYPGRRTHPAEFGDLVKEQQRPPPRDVRSSACARSKPERPGPVPAPATSRPRTLSHRPQGFGGESSGGAAVCNFILRGLWYPVSVVEEPTFRALLRAADPRPCAGRRSSLSCLLVNCGVTTDLWHTPRAEPRLNISLSSARGPPQRRRVFSVGSKCLKTFEVAGRRHGGEQSPGPCTRLCGVGVSTRCLSGTTRSSRGVEEALRLPRVEAFLSRLPQAGGPFRTWSVSLYVRGEKRRQHGMAERPLVRDPWGAPGRPLRTCWQAAPRAGARHRRRQTGREARAASSGA